MANWKAILGGAGAGFLFGGPLGAAIGGGALAFATRDGAVPASAVAAPGAGNSAAAAAAMPDVLGSTKDEAIVGVILDTSTDLQGGPIVVDHPAPRLDGGDGIVSLYTPPLADTSGGGSFYVGPGGIVGGGGDRQPVLRPDYS